MSLPCEAHTRDRVENIYFQRRSPSGDIHKCLKKSTSGESQKVDYFGNFCSSPGGALPCTPI